MANYLAKIGELFGNFQGVPSSRLLRATSTTSGDVFYPDGRNVRIIAAELGISKTTMMKVKAVAAEFRI